jgi:hypothetical protein
MSDAVTWWVCPRCGGPAALGWEERRVAEIDCSGGCPLTEEHLAAVRRSVTPPPAGLEKSS